MQPGGKSVGRVRYVVRQSIVQDDKYANSVLFHHELWSMEIFCIKIFFWDMVLNCSLFMGKIDVILNCRGLVGKPWMLACFQMINWSRKFFNICGKKEKYAEGFLFGNGRNMWQWQSNFKKVQSGGKSAGRVTYPISDFDTILMSVWTCKISSCHKTPSTNLNRQKEIIFCSHQALCSWWF